MMTTMPDDSKRWTINDYIVSFGIYAKWTNNIKQNKQWNKYGLLSISVWLEVKLIVTSKSLYFY